MNHHEEQASHRLLDANLNRSFEAFRTLEDIARFQSQSVFQTKYKTLRHQLRAATQEWIHEALYASRDAGQDVGRETKTAAEASREGGLSQIASAASQRVQQSLRCLEEVSKFMYPNTAAAIETIRYQVYDLNAKLLLAQQRDTAFLAKAKLYVLADCQLPLQAFVSRVRELGLAGVDLIQIRDKQIDAQELIRYTQAAVHAVDATTTRMIVNDRADVLQCTDAFGLHVGQTDLSVSQSRSLIRPACVLGLSTHDLEQVRAAVALGVDCIGCGPTYRSNTKNFSAFSGLAFLTETAEFLQSVHSQLPAFAIGGIELSNLKPLLGTGIGRVAVSKAVWGADRPGDAAASFRKILDSF